MSKIEGRGCAQKGKRGREIRVGIPVLLAVLLMAGGASATYPEPFFYFTISNFSTNGYHIFDEGVDGIWNDQYPQNGYWAKLEQTQYFSSDTYIRITFISNGISNTCSQGYVRISVNDVTQYQTPGSGYGCRGQHITPQILFLAGNNKLTFLEYNKYGGEAGNTYISDYEIITSEVTISCPIGWCYVASNYSSKTLLELDNLFSTDTIQGRYNATSQKYESHRTGYAFNQNVTAYQKEGYYMYFTSATDVVTTPGSTPSITLKTGWNLVGNYGSSARTLSALKTSIGSSATQAKYYDKTLKAWVSSDSQSVPAMESFMVYCTSQIDWSG